VLLAGGGTAGHVSPLLALADCLRRRDPTVRVTALGTAAGLVSGRLTFLLGVAVGLGALLAASRGRRAAAAVLAALTALASPVAATFVALAAAAWLVGTRPPGGRPGWRGPAGPAALALAALAPAVLLAYAFPEGGAFPFVASSFWPTVPAIVALALVLPRDQPVLRAGAALYVLALVASFVLSTPMGGNAARLGSLAAGPVAAAALWGRRPVALALLAVPLLWLQWGAAVDDWARAASDASVHRAYYDGLVGELRRRAGPPGASTGRLEVPFTDNHWESRWLAPNVPLARGWERQLDRERNALFYDDRPLTPARYRRWLDDHAVRWVALPDAPIDYSSAAEAQLVRDGLPYLREVWRDPHWRLFAVRDPAPVARGAARPAAATLGPQSVALRAGAAGTLDVRVRWSPYWFLERGRGCVAEGQGGWLRVALRAPGEVRLGMRFSPGRVGAAGARCTA